MGVGVEVPVQEVDDVVEVLLLALGHVLHQEAPGDAPALDHGLEHGEDVAAPLRLVGQDRARRVEHPRRDQPARSRPQAVGLAEVEHAVVAAVPVLQAAAHLGLRGARLQAVVGVGEVVAGVVELRREVVALGLALLADLLRLLVVLVHVAGNGAEVVEELRVDRPALVLRPDRLAHDALALGLHGLAQGEATASVHDVGEPLVFAAVLVGGLGRGPEPPLVDAPAVGAQRVVVVRMQLQAAARG